MTIDMSIIERAYELGRAAERQKMTDLAVIAGNQQSLANLSSAVPPPKPDPAVALMPTHIIRASAAKPAKKAAGPRTKGVKEAILALIAGLPMSPAAIIGATGFKSTSVRATLMSLKKSGLAMSDDGRWSATHTAHGNSEEVEFNTVGR